MGRSRGRSGSAAQRRKSDIILTAPKTTRNPRQFANIRVFANSIVDYRSIRQIPQILSKQSITLTRSPHYRFKRHARASKGPHADQGASRQTSDKQPYFRHSAAFA
jgi:hypothetical protein